MATLQIIKETNKVWRHVPSDKDEYIVSKLYIKSDGDNIRIVEQGGSQRGEYNFADVSVFDIGGSSETFTSVSELMQRLEALNYIGFFYDGEVTPNYKIYTALLTQSGTDAPTAIVLENTIGNIVWSRVSLGQYQGLLYNAFANNKTFVICNHNSKSYFVEINRANNDLILLKTVGISDYEDDILGNTPIEIRVYN